jgi:hypothetical protein
MTLGSCQVPGTKATSMTTAKYANIFHYPQPKAKAPQPSIHDFPTKGNSNKNAKKKEHNVDKKEGASSSCHSSSNSTK